MAGIRTCDRESQVQRPNHYTTEPPRCLLVCWILDVLLAKTKDESVELGVFEEKN